MKEGKGRLRPGVAANQVIEDMFNNQDRNKDGKLTEDELRPREDEEAEEMRRDEL